MRRTVRLLQLALPVLLGAGLVLGAAAAARAAEEADPGTAEERLTEYLRQREEKRILKEQRRAEEEAARQAEAELRAQRQAEEAAARAEADAERQAARQAERAATQAAAMQSGAGLPRGLAWAQGSVRLTHLADDPTIRAYLDRVDRQEASPYQLAALGNFLAEAGLLAEAREYYEVALRLEQDDPVLWINFGTLNRQLGQPKEALEAYSQALRINRNNAVAHYNMGASYDELGKYDRALESYKTALTLDPTLGDPAVNPQAATNERLNVVRLMLYQEQAGSIGLPMLDVPRGSLDADADAEPEPDRR